MLNKSNLPKAGSLCTRLDSGTSSVSVSDESDVICLLEAKAYSQTEERLWIQHLQSKYQISSIHLNLNQLKQNPKLQCNFQILTTSANLNNVG